MTRLRRAITPRCRTQWRPVGDPGSHEFHVEVLADEETGKVRALLTDLEFKPFETTAKSLSINMVLGGNLVSLRWIAPTTPHRSNSKRRTRHSPKRFTTAGRARRVAIEISGSPPSALTSHNGSHEGEAGHEQ